MVIGDNQSATIKARDELLYRIQRIVQID